MISTEELINSAVMLWAVIDPIGTVPVFIAVTKKHTEVERKKIATFSSLVALGVLVFFLVVGEILLRRVGVPLAAFQTSGGIILFIFALNMIFGSSKPEEELALVKSHKETAIFPLAMPSIASPGAILAVVLLTDNARHSWHNQLTTGLVLVAVLFINFLFMRFAGSIHKKIGDSGAIIISKIMGLILASVAANNILMGIKEFFKIS